MSRMAHELGEDPVEFRRKNFIQPDQFPYQTPVALLVRQRQLRSRARQGARHGGLQGAARRAGRRTREGPLSRHRLLELGGSVRPRALRKVVGSLGAQAGQWESAVVRVMPTGKMEVLTGSHSHGQGHETAFAQVAADELQVPMGDVAIVHGDTAEIQFGWGTYGSRSGPVGGGAHEARRRQDPRQGHAHRRASARSRAGRCRVRRRQVHGEGRARAHQDVRFDVALQAHLAHNMPEPIWSPDSRRATSTIRRTWSIPFGTHIAVVEVDPDTGDVTLRRYIAVDDCGPAHQPADRRRPGARRHRARHGSGAARECDATTIRRSSRAARSSNTRCRAPTICPRSSSDHTVTPSPHNPLGVKGIGEAGTIASTAAVANAVIDALKPFGITHLDMPLHRRKGVARDRGRPAPRSAAVRLRSLSRSYRSRHVSSSIHVSPGHERPGRDRDASRSEPDAKLLAGGHSLIPPMKLRLASPLDARRSRRPAGAARHPARWRHHRDRRADDASRDRVLEGADGGLSDPAGSGRAHRRSARAQPRHDRRQRGACRSGRRLPRRRARAGRDDAGGRAERPPQRLPPTTSSRACSRRRFGRTRCSPRIRVPASHLRHRHGLREVPASGVALRDRRRGGRGHGGEWRVPSGARGASPARRSQRHASASRSKRRSSAQPLDDAALAAGVSGRDRA